MSTPKRLRLIVHVDGPLLIGGQSAPPVGVDALTAVDDDGRPFLPASTLKGAIREAAWRNARCAPDGARKVCVPWAPCRGELCEICRLFGPSGRDRPDVSIAVGDEILVPWDGGGPAARIVSAFRVGDARVEVGKEPPALGLRHGVAIDRWLGRAHDGLLWQRIMAEGGQDGHRYVAEAWVDLGESDRKLLDEAIAAVESLGNSQSRGVGRVRMWLEKSGSEPVESIKPKPIPATTDGQYLVSVHTLEPLHLGGFPVPGSLRETERFISGAALRGALYAALRAAGESDADSVRVVTALSFSDLHPAPGGEELRPPALVPRPWMECRTCEKIFDRSLHEALARWLAESHEIGLPPDRCPTPTCLDPLKPAGGLTTRGKTRVRLVTRLARDPALGSGAEGLLYAREQIETGSWFVGTVTGLDASARQALERVGARVPILIGGMRNRGLGRVQLQLRPAHTAKEIVNRVNDWRGKRNVEKIGGPFPIDRLMLVSARTPLSTNEALASFFSRELGVPVTVHAAWERRAPRALGWDARATGGGASRSVVDAIREGSAWVVESDPVSPDRLRKAEIEGVGDHREHGLGRLLFCPPVPGSL